MYLRGLLNNGHPKKELPGLNAMPRIILGKLPQHRTSCLFLIQVASDVAWSRNVWGGLLACEIVEKEEEINIKQCFYDDKETKTLKYKMTTTKQSLCM